MPNDLRPRVDELTTQLADARREIEDVRGVADAMFMTLQGVVGVLDEAIPGTAGRLHQLLVDAAQRESSSSIEIWPQETVGRRRARERIRLVLRHYVRDVAKRPK